MKKRSSQDTKKRRIEETKQPRHEEKRRNEETKQPRHEETMAKLTPWLNKTRVILASMNYYLLIALDDPPNMSLL